MHRQIDQHYYTSSSTMGGLSTLDSSNGLSQAEISHLENHIIYTPPIGLLSVSEKSDIERLFPKNISFFRLKNNRFVYLHSTYTGRSNHTPNRFGNFFSHSIILEENAPPSFFAVSILPPSNNFLAKMAGTDYKPFLFKQSFPIDEDISYRHSLEQVTLSIDDSAKITEHFFDAFCDFINVPNRTSFFARIIDWIAEGWFSTKGHNITICDTKDNLQDWVLAIDFFLPRVIANQISFASYVEHPSEMNFQITGVVPENQIDKLESKYKYINTTKASDHSPSGTFARYLVNCIRHQDITAWTLIAQLTDKLKMREMQTLNILSQYIHFRENTVSKSGADYVYIWDALKKHELSIPEDELDLLLKNARQAGSELFLAIIKKEVVELLNVKGHTKEIFYKFYKKTESEPLPVIRSYVDIYLSAHKNSLHASKAAFDILSDKSLTPVQQDTNTVMRLLHLTDNLLNSETADVNAVYILLSKRKQELSLEDHEMPQTFISIASNKIMKHLAETGSNAISYPGLRRLTLERFFEKISEVLYKWAVTSIPQKRYGACEHFFDDHYAATDKVLNEVLGMSLKKKEFWPYFFSYYENKANADLPDKEFLRTAFIVFLLSEKIRLSEVGVVSDGKKLSEQELTTITFLAKSILGKEFDINDLNSLKENRHFIDYNMFNYKKPKG